MLADSVLVRARYQAADFSLYPHMSEGVRHGASFIRALIPPMRPHPHDLIISRRPHLLTLAPWASGFQHVDLGEGGTKTDGLCVRRRWGDWRPGAGSGAGRLGQGVEKDP